MELKVGWQDFSSYGLFTRKVGETEVFKNNLYISVPSAVTLKDRNYLINPLHQDVGKIKVMEVEDYRFDQRLL
jgi:RES domain-containing protein